MDDSILKQVAQKIYCSGTTMLLHMLCWSLPEVRNRIRECSKFTTEVRTFHNTTLQCFMIYILKNRDRELLLALDGIWDGGRNYFFEIRGMRYSNYETNELRHCMNR